MLGQIVNGVRPDRFRHNHQSFVRLGICLWDDIIEYGGQQSWKYSEFYLPALARGIQDSQPEVRLILLFLQSIKRDVSSRWPSSLYCPVRN